MQPVCRPQMHYHCHSWLERCALLRLAGPVALLTIFLLIAKPPRVFADDGGAGAGLPLTAADLAAQILAAATGSATPAPTDGDYNSTGVTGVFNGNSTVGCSYDPLTRNAKRVVTDIVVPGTIGSYPLKMTTIIPAVSIPTGNMNMAGLQAVTARSFMLPTAGPTIIPVEVLPQESLSILTPREETG